MEKENKTWRQDISQQPMLIVDLGSGRWLNHRTGHETYNLTPNSVDGRYYGYCPPDDRLDITKLGAKKSDESISGVLVVYAQKQCDSSDREIIAFCENATVHKKGKDNKRLGRIINDNGKKEYCSYTIESDTLVDLSEAKSKSKFVIHIADYNVYMFRRQRVFKGTYPKLDRCIQNYILKYLDAMGHDDDFLYQESIQNAEGGSVKPIDTSMERPQYSSGPDGRIVKKNPKIAKQALASSKYKCAIDAHHTTFTTSRGVLYMEGHHLIPCTSNNAERFWKQKERNIDCMNNIVSLCPTCHRKIHYASDKEKRIMIEQLYKKYKDKLREVGLDISLTELLELYDI
ncbi:MAG: hypothetical protein K2K51_04125 [Bacteroidales bacterium]|nr:hypothetical protein [Bacteroidales bacterium]